MAQVFDIKLKGVRQVLQVFAALARQNPRAAQSALRSIGEVDLTKMKRRTPVDLGNLRGTGRVENLAGLGIRWAFGGTTGKKLRRGKKVFVDYAVVVHQNLRARHNPPTQSKFIESVLTEELPNYPRRLGQRWAREMGLA